MPDENGVLSRSYDPATNRLRTVEVVGTPGPVSRKDANGVWGLVFDETAEAIRVVLV